MQKRHIIIKQFIVDEHESDRGLAWAIVEKVHVFCALGMWQHKLFLQHFRD